MKSVEGSPVQVELVPDIRGRTALHECVANTYIKAAETILELIGSNSLDNHISNILDTVPGLISTCPLAISNYFNKRTFECTWSVKHTKGNLKTTDDDVDFCVFSKPMITLDEQSLEDHMF